MPRLIILLLSISLAACDGVSKWARCEKSCGVRKAKMISDVDGEVCHCKTEIGWTEEINTHSISVSPIPPDPFNKKEKK